MDKETLLIALGDADQHIRKAGIRLSEKYILNGDEGVLKKLLSMKNDQSKEVLGQLVLSLNQSNNASVRKFIKDIFLKYESDPLLSGIKSMLVSNEEKKKFGVKLVSLQDDARKRVIKGSQIFNSLCSSCHGPKGIGLPNKIAPPLIGKIKLLNNRDASIKILLHGLKGPVDGITYPDIMMPMKSYDDEWIASVLNYVRFDLSMQSFPELPQKYLNSLMITPDEVSKLRKQNTDRTEPWTWEELLRKKDK
jgi:mono/diheme cytochrome c family protein